ncbi:uncharacterized protein [Temnothorax nylanderi]|uniref:uncharacterized protein isoform X2 n=1 Tax=Temnothorax nylanderi TaxID=102681 RepID=UPI003A837D85
MFNTPPKRTTRSSARALNMENRNQSNDQVPFATIDETSPAPVGGEDVASIDILSEPVQASAVRSAGAGDRLAALGLDAGIMSRLSIGHSPMIGRGGTPGGRGRGSRGATPIPSEDFRSMRIETTLGSLTNRLDGFDVRIGRVEALESKMTEIMGNMKLLIDQLNNKTSASPNDTPVVDTGLSSSLRNTNGLRSSVIELPGNNNNTLINNPQAVSYRKIDTAGAGLSNNLNDTAWPRSSGTRRARSLLQNGDTLDLRGSVERDTRHVNFREENLIDSRFMDTEQSNRRVNRLSNNPVRLVVAEMTPEGELVTQENLTNEEYRQIMQNRFETERGETRTHNFRSWHEQRSPSVRRGVLSWRSSESDDSDDNTRGADGYQHARVRRNALSTNRYGGRENNSPAYNRELESAMKIGRIVRDWNLTFPKTEKDPEKFLLILKDQLSVSGIRKDLFVFCLSSVFEGPYRAWYLLNKQRWQTWKDFTRAFRFQWAVKKDDGALFLEVCNLKFEKGETLAEFTCRARLIFERMQSPPSFREQLKQILVKFNPRLTFEVLNLSIRDYDEFLHYLNERNYLYNRSVEAQKGARGRFSKSDLGCLQDDTDESDIQSIGGGSSDEESATELRAIQTKPRNVKKENNSANNTKTLVKQRLEKNIATFKKAAKSSTDTPNEQPPAPQAKPARDFTKILCYNCGEMGHTARFCTAERQVLCHICLNKGHVNRDCPTRSGNEQGRQ